MKIILLALLLVPELLSLVPDITITPNSIVTHHDTVPRFATNADRIAVQNGDWSNPDTWGGSSGNVVKIPEGIEVTLAGDISVDSIEVSGLLTIDPNSDTNLSLIDLTIMPGGELRAQNQDHDITITFRDTPIRTNDPLQYGNGLLIFGKCVIHGRPTKSYSRLSADALAGSTVITLQDTVNWRVGDTLVFPDTRHINPINHPRYYTYVPQWETKVIAGINGSSVVLTEPLQFNHVGPQDADGQPTIGFDGNIVAPHIGNLTRNISLRSENPNGIRGHVMAMGEAYKDIRYTAFESLGRTKAAPLGNGNQVGRYSDHNHHISGPPEGIPVGEELYQVVGIGNSYIDNLKWAVTIHDTHFGLFSENVFYDTDGSALATESGNEFGNKILNNLVIRVKNPNLHLPVTGIGVASINDGAIGDGYWLSSALSEVRGNIAANVSKTGFMYWPKNIVSPSDRIRMVRVPKERGDSTDISGEYDIINVMLYPVDNFSNNEVYGATTSAIDIWQVGNRNWYPQATPTILTDTTVWHVSGSGIWFYYTSDYILDGWIQRGAPYAINQHISKGGPSNPSAGSAIVHGGSDARTSTIRRGDFQGLTIAYTNRGGGRSDNLLIEDSYFDNFINIIVRPYQIGAGDGSRDLRIRNCSFGFLSNPNAKTIQMLWQPATIENTRFKESVTLEVNGKQYNLYYEMQAPEAVIPLHGGKSFFPEPGITNIMGLEKYGIVPIGKLFPSNVTTGRELANTLRVVGLVEEK